jgi:hypothetical protein
MNCDCVILELRLRSNISLKVVELRLRKCFLQVAELRLRAQKKVVYAHLCLFIVIRTAALTVVCFKKGDAILILPFTEDSL